MSPARSRTGLLAPLYDRLTAPIERGGLQRWRSATWAEVDGSGIGLEVGVGTGANLPLHPPGARVVMMDASEGMLKQTRRKAPSGAPLVAADARSLPFADGTFDWVVATLVFCEVADPVAGLREVRRVLSTGGRLVLLEHVRPAGWRGRAADALTALTAPVWGEHFNRDTVSLVCTAGYEIHSIRWMWSDAVVLIVASR